MNAIAVCRDGKVVAVQGTMADVTELRANQAQLAKLHDELEQCVALRTAALVTEVVRVPQLSRDRPLVP